MTAVDPAAGDESSRPREWFIYYRVPTERTQALRPIVLAWQRGLRARWPGLRSRLLTRPPVPGEPATWMETYALEAPPDAATLAALEDSLAAGPSWPEEIASATRHVEVFLPLDGVA